MSSCGSSSVGPRASESCFEKKISLPMGSAAGVLAKYSVKELAGYPIVHMSLHTPCCSLFCLFLLTPIHLCFHARFVLCTALKNEMQCPFRSAMPLLYLSLQSRYQSHHAIRSCIPHQSDNSSILIASPPVRGSPKTIFVLSMKMSSKSSCLMDAVLVSAWPLKIPLTNSPLSIF